MKYVKILALISCLSFGHSAKSQQILELGKWNNNANFVVQYYQEHVITSSTAGIVFLDVSDPSNPQPSASLGNPSYFPMAITIDNHYAYFGGGMIGYFMIADISNINFPVQTGITMDIYGTAYQIAVSGNFAFMPVNSDTLYAIDISNKNSPFVAGRMDMGSFCSGIGIRGNYAFIGTSAGLKVVDISDPANMSVVTTFGGGYENIICDTVNNRLFAAKNGTGFDVIDITDPVNPAGLFQGVGGNSSGVLCYKDGKIFQIGPGTVSAFEIGMSSATYLCSYSATITGQVVGVTARDSVFYLSTVNNVHVLQYSSTLPTGIRETYTPEVLNLFPNPANTSISIAVNPDLQHINVTIFNDQGRIMPVNYLLKNRYTEVDVRGLPPGLYHARITADNFSGTGNFIKE